MKGEIIQPRVIRAGQAAAYLGMSSPHFNARVRPYIVEVQDAHSMICFDRLDLDAWWEHHKKANGKPAQEYLKWQKEPPVSESKAKSGMLIKLYAENTFEKALEKRSFKKQSGI